MSARSASMDDDLGAGEVPEPGTFDRAADRGIAILRVALIPIALIEYPARRADLAIDAYPIIFGLLVIYAVAVFALTMAPRAKAPSSSVQALVDLAIIGGLVYASGGLHSPLRVAFYVGPIIAALRLSPTLTAAWTAIAVGSYVAATVLNPAAHARGDTRLLIAEALTLTWAGGAAVILSQQVGRRARSVATLAASRRSLVQQLLHVEADERRRLAQVLHDDAIQTLLVARQEVADMAVDVPGAHDRAKQALDETLGQLRSEVFAMHPVGLELVGLEAVLQGLAGTAAQRGRFTTDLQVDPSLVHIRSDLAAAVARELLTNAAKHSVASHVEVVASAAGAGALALSVTDDGVGIGDGRPDAALADGHIGLAALAERLNAVGGQLRIDETRRRGAKVTATIPYDGRSESGASPSPRPGSDPAS